MVNGDFFLIWYKWLLVAVFIAAFSVQLFFYLYYYTAVIRRSRLVQKGKVAFTDAQPPVSIIVCAKNEVENLAEFLPLILEQEYPKYEVIVINDGSKDDSKKKILELKDKIIFIDKKNEGVIATKNLGLERAKGSWIIFLDADDYLDERYIEKCLKLARSTGSDIVYTNMQLFGAKKEQPRAGCSFCFAGMPVRRAQRRRAATPATQSRSVTLK